MRLFSSAHRPGRHPWLVGSHNQPCVISGRCRLVFYSLSAATNRQTPDQVRRLVHKAYRMEEYKLLHGAEDFPVRVPIWSELEATNLLPPAQVDGQAGAPRKGPRKRARIPGKGDQNQRPLAGYSGRNTTPVASLGAPAGTSAATTSEPRVWGALAIERYQGDGSVHNPGVRQSAASPASLLHTNSLVAVGSQQGGTPVNVVDSSQGSSQAS